MKKVLIILFTIGLLMFIGFGLATYFEIKKGSNTPSHPLNYEKVYQKEDTSIKKLKVNSQLADVKVKRGKHFSVKAKSGDKEHTEITSKIKNGTLFVKEAHKGSKINFNVQGIKPTDITITVPNRMLEKAELYNDTSDITIEGLKAKQVEAVTNTGDIQFKNSESKQLDLTSDTGDIELLKTEFKDVSAQSDTGDVIIKSINGDADIDTSTDTGDIELDYAKAPKNTKLINKTDEDNGSEIRVNQPQLKNEKYGQGNFKVQVDTDTGKVVIN
ncbi:MULTISPECIES: DUF4097 family beta strand repeat-containing protein [Staphylococcus]|nr:MULTISPECIES: DUF4097 family beta strand repeat-containing protein [Staphylococcus]AMY05753.1 hypothetical protein A4G25_07365 [Staphylococcus condimenti]APR61959.1 hypothetical protein BTZ13_12395 [Staphylococcus condimenti]MDK8645429.1 DUF4097 family beta strand repeat-containing protein [Staphylococcus condimenti]OFP03849.1 hypothetical protein HMPREF3007_07460 [Staphylococcus sp. HMSC065E08]QQS82446.1 DUF4097 family beta strand repeat protein [Staphylococcus condimenti]